MLSGQDAPVASFCANVLFVWIRILLRAACSEGRGRGIRRSARTEGWNFCLGSCDTAQSRVVVSGSRDGSIHYLFSSLFKGVSSLGRTLSRTADESGSKRHCVLICSRMAKGLRACKACKLCVRARATRHRTRHLKL